MSFDKFEDTIHEGSRQFPLLELFILSEIHLVFVLLYHIKSLMFTIVGGKPFLLLSSVPHQYRKSLIGVSHQRFQFVFLY